MTHSELCELSCKHFLKDYHVGLWEYQSFSTTEFPDVLLLGTKPSMLLEIKTSRSDFLADSKKTARIKYVLGNAYQGFRTEMDRFNEVIESGYYRHTKRTYYELKHIEHYHNQMPGHCEYIEKPHLGTFRYFVCENEIIKPEDLPEGWGLFWVNGSKFKKKQDSKPFRPNMMMERDIVIHAMRQFANSGNNMKRIMVKPY